MTLPKFIITLERQRVGESCSGIGVFRLAMVNQQDEIRTVVNAVLGECIWNLSYDERRRVIVLELTCVFL